MSGTDRSSPARAMLLAAAVKVDDARDRAAAGGAERHVVAREHHAVLLRPKIAARLVIRAFERADVRRVGVGREKARLGFLFLAEERVHLGLRALFGANLPALGLVLARRRFEGLLGPRRRHGRAFTHEVAPLEALRVAERRD